MANLTTAWRNEIYNLVFQAVETDALTNVYLRLFVDDPGVGGSFTDEVSGGSYTGQAIDAKMGAPTNGAGTNDTQIDYADMPATTVSHWAICKTAAGTVDAKEMILFGPFATPTVVGAGAFFSVLVGELEGAVI